ncbi:hypothetical protein MHLP_03730 [Candidatus Mycoplasma haematolamae str. Purdue]|uniref:Uncharacterized protein n=1 Tax=Mycoplasma haematolamae (strain Purdue) TaxID=1212765 RepID=I7CGD4_MYCHA|nr:hypothetical protein [Candidatus Mycoplasma haematolamae]AFO52326.1 hypothetical protein MHLP_03730 [Candidatus Mycoplasma haematolamae str. Purdue]
MHTAYKILLGLLGTGILGGAGYGVYEGVKPALVDQKEKCDENCDCETETCTEECTCEGERPCCKKEDGKCCCCKKDGKKCCCKCKNQ